MMFRDNPIPMPPLACAVCGEDMIVGPHELEESPGVSHHLDTDGGIDYDADAQHVAVPEENIGFRHD